MTVSRKFVEIMTEYNKIQVDYRDESKKKIARQMEIAGSAVTDDELERMLEGGDGAMLMGHVKIEGNEDQLRYNSFSINVVLLNLKIYLDCDCAMNALNFNISRNQIGYICILNIPFFLRQTINDIQNRHEMFLSLEKSITELHDMFLDIAQLIESQGEMVNRIGNAFTINLFSTGHIEILKPKNNHNYKSIYFAYLIFRYSCGKCG